MTPDDFSAMLGVASLPPVCRSMIKEMDFTRRVPYYLEDQQEIMLRVLKHIDGLGDANVSGLGKYEDRRNLGTLLRRE